MKKASILFIPGTPHASKYYRLMLPAQKLSELGYTVNETFFSTVDPITLLAKDSAGNIVDLKKAEVIVFQMVWFEALIKVIKKVKALGIKTFMDVDDHYGALPANNPAFRSFHPKTMLMKNKEGNKEFRQVPQKFKLTHTRHGTHYVRERDNEEKINFAIDNLYQAMQLVDFVQVSTPELADYYQAFNKNILVLPNYIDMDYYQIKKPKNSIVSLGWYGTMTHADDLAIINGLIPDNCKLIIIGAENMVKGENLFTSVKNLELRPPFGEIFNLADAIKDIDIGLCPLVDNQFNRGKSELKAMEFNAMGIPVVASDVAPYSRYVSHGENGFLIKGNKTKFWIRYINQLINDGGLRNEMSLKAKQKAETKDISKNIHLWEEVYNGSIQ